MSNIDPAAAASIDAAVDTLIIAVSRLNDVLVKNGYQPLIMPTRHSPIEPFFADLTNLINRLNAEMTR